MFSIDNPERSADEFSDEESEYLWDYKKQKFDGIDLILSCGDLDAEYFKWKEEGSNEKPAGPQRKGLKSLFGKKS